MRKYILLPLLSLLFSVTAWAQGEMKLKLNDDGSHYVKLVFTNQIWLRGNQSNPGTTVLGVPAANTLDIGLRRTRLQMIAQTTDRMFFYMQFGMNNFNFLSGNGGNRKVQAFFHDAVGEYNAFKGKNTLKIGAGLTITNGLSRFSQPSIGTIMTLDVPVFAQATVDQVDQFSRKLSFYVRGQVKRLDYRIALSDPFPITSNGVAQPAIGPDATFAQLGHHKQYQGYFVWNFFDSEPHTTPYMQGTYLGKKKVLNLEAGAIYQKAATWSRNGADTTYHPMALWSVAGFLDMPLSREKGTAISAYLAYFSTDYGPNYIRHNGIMNPANGLNANGTFSGAGNSYPMFGTGSVVYGQVGYKFPDSLFKSLGTLMPYASAQYGQYQRLDDPMLVADVGINWLMQGHTQKLSLDLQNRPVFATDAAGSVQATTRKNALILQYQTAF